VVSANGQDSGQEGEKAQEGNVKEEKATKRQKPAQRWRSVPAVSEQARLAS